MSDIHIEAPGGDGPALKAAIVALLAGQILAPLAIAPASNTLQIGLADAASPVAQTIAPQGVSAGTANTAGADFTLGGSIGTGNANGGAIQFAISLAGSTGSSQNARTNIVKLAGTGHLLWNTDNTYDIGASGATRPRTLHVGTSVIINGSTIASAAFKATGTSGNTVPLLDGANTWSAQQTLTGTGAQMVRGAASNTGVYEKWTNNGGNYYIGVESSTGGSLISGADAFTLAFVTESNRPMEWAINNSSRLKLTSSAFTLGGVAIPTISSSDILSNKTIASPTLSGTVAGTPTIASALTWSTAQQFPGNTGIKAADPHLAFFRANGTRNGYTQMLDAGRWIFSCETGTAGFNFGTNGSNVTIDGNVAMHAGNVATYALPIGGGTLTGTLRMQNGTQTQEITARFNSGGDYRYAGIKFEEVNTWDGEIQFWTTPVSGSAAAADAAYAKRFTISQAGGMYSTNATGGDKGTDTINAKAVYDDNVILTDLVSQFAATGQIDRVKYKDHPLLDAVQPWWFDPDSYAKFWKEAHHLPAMLSWEEEKKRPSLGQVVTRQTAELEIHAALLSNDNDRIKALQARVAHLERELLNAA